MGTNSLPCLKVVSKQETWPEATFTVKVKSFSVAVSGCFAAILMSNQTFIVAFFFYLNKEEIMLKLYNVKT